MRTHSRSNKATYFTHRLLLDVEQEAGIAALGSLKKVSILDRERCDIVWVLQKIVDNDAVVTIANFLHADIGVSVDLDSGLCCQASLPTPSVQKN